MKLFYFNDTTKNQLIYVDDLFGGPVILETATGYLADIDIKENQIPFIKVWGTGIVLISSMDAPTNVTIV